MATGKTGYIDVTVMPQSVGKVRVYWREDYDAVNNHSTITVTDVQGYLWHRNGWAKVALKITAGDVTVMNSSGQWMFSANADTTLRSVVSTSDYTVGFSEVTSAPIYHNDDGSKTITITFTLVDCTISSVGFNATDNQSTSATVALTPIPRASTISATDANIESVSTVTVNRKSSAYTHSIKYTFGSLSGYINADGSVSSTEVKHSETSIGFTVPTSFYAQIPDAKSGICTLSVITYSGDTQIGEAKTCTFVCTAAQSLCAPSVSGTVVDVNEDTLALTGDENKLVRFYSRALATIAATAKYSASVVSKIIAGVAVTENSHTIDAVEASSFAFEATDSRGYSNSVTVTKKLIEYIKLTANMTVSRDDPTSGKATLYIVGDYFNGSFGAVSNALTVKYRINSGSWVTITPVISGNTYTATASLSDLDYQSTFAFEVMVSDKLASVTKSAPLNKGIANFHMGEEDVTFEAQLNANGGLNVKGDFTADSADFLQLKIGGKALWEYLMPVGYLYMSSEPTSPAALFGGTWEQITDRVIIGADGDYAVNSWERVE